MSQSQQTLSKVPLTIGITGHRDLREEEDEKLRHAVRKIFTYLQTHYPNTPLQLLSPLAEGADCLVAEVALEQKIQLIVPLPLPQDLYEQDFATPDALQNFHHLLKQAQTVFTLPLLDNNDREAVTDYNHARTKQYALVGAYIARHSHVLIALWDDIPLEKSAGTSQVVKFKRTGEMKDLPEEYRPPHSPLDVPDTGPVCHVITARKNGTDLPNIGEIKILLPDTESKKSLNSLLSKELKALNQFNQDVEKYSKRVDLHEQMLNSQKNLLPQTMWENMTHLSPAFKNMLSVYGTANILARHFQTRIRQAMLIASLAIIAMVSSYTSYLYFHPHCHLLLASYLFFLIVAWGILGWIKINHYDTKGLDYRALAEGLRVQLFWHLAGLKHGAADYYLHRQRGELAWIRNSIRALNVYDWIETRETLEVTYWHWIQHQCDYFNSSAPRNHAKHQHFTKLANLLLIVGSGLAFIIFTGLMMNWLILNPLLHFSMVLSIAIIPTTAVLIYRYVELVAFSDQAKQYYRMSDLFTKASDWLQQAKQNLDNAAYEKEAEKVLFQLGKEALDENSDWILVHRKKPIDVRRTFGNKNLR